jgi:hypothetical protein
MKYDSSHVNDSTSNNTPDSLDVNKSGSVQPHDKSSVALQIISPVSGVKCWKLRSYCVAKPIRAPL